ncbi:class I SAM-dependent methyltransferase [Euzebya tangerina]|uniref:class I SAM-dependent methyltransferase n=1 Tax=Euzebya tangerina TaxID=591198 RepID=UPI000E30F369|nr:class I SAM-dependent methyltransferase [Euzebya tangerina]
MPAGIPTFGRLRSRFEARTLDLIDPAVHRLHGEAKQAAIGAMTGTVVDVGAGTGANLRYYPAGTTVIAVEPNPVMHDRLRQKAEKHGVDLQIRTVAGERMGLEDDEADHAVGTLVLCGVGDPASVVGEIQRVVKPGGTFFFLEHVVATTPGVRLLQRVTRPAQKWIANGCDVMRDTGQLLTSAGFAELDLTTIDEGWTSFNTRIMIRGTAVID